MAGNVIGLLLWLFQFVLGVTVFLKVWELFHMDNVETRAWVNLLIGAVLLFAFGHILVGYGNMGAASLKALLP